MIFTGEAELRLHRCCFTGHRPEKLLVSEHRIQYRLEQEIRKAAAEGYTVFISGMARGVDIWAAEIVLKLRREGLFVRLICASPFPGFEMGWPGNRQMRYRSVLTQADLTRFICPSYSKDCFSIRNRWMVNHSSRIIAVYNGTPGGTRNTIDYARQCGLSIHSIDG